MTAPPDASRSVPCAQCRKRPVVAEYRPFCSKRCADIDLGQWLKGGYAIPGAPVEEAGETPGPQRPDGD